MITIKMHGALRLVECSSDGLTYDCALAELKTCAPCRAAQLKSLSRPVRSFRGYHCHRPEYRPACKVAFRLWGDALRQTQLQLYQRKLRREAMEAKKQVVVLSLDVPSAALSHCIPSPMQAMANRAEAEAAQADRAKQKRLKRAKQRKKPLKKASQEGTEAPV